MKTVKVNLGENSYNVYIGSGTVSKASELFDLDRRVLIVTDDGVPKDYAEAVKKQCKEGHIVTFGQGEGSKCFENVLTLNRVMLEKNFNRHDCVVAVGGGVIGDLSGFAAACYMRGIDFYNIPTTVLSCVDSSVGGKTAVNLDGVKNIVGAFKQPKGVLIDTQLLCTLDSRHFSNGISEAVKMALTFDEKLFELFEKEDAKENISEIIYKSVTLKARVVEEDEKESGLRKVLNFGHTVGHGIESLGLGYYHGECVGLGMLSMCSDEVRVRLLDVLKKLSLPIEAVFDKQKAYEAITHDKKSENDGITVVMVNKIGSYEMKKMSLNEIREKL